MTKMDLNKFSRVSESLRQYRRAELKDFEKETGAKPVDLLYVDPLPGDAILQSVLSGNTTFLLGRKGTGKSTVFARSQSFLREQNNILPAYIDVKSIYDVMASVEFPEADLNHYGISIGTYRSHILRKSLLSQIINELIKEIRLSCDRLSIIQKWTGKKRKFNELVDELEKISQRVKSVKLEVNEIPVLQKISTQLRLKKQKEQSRKTNQSSNANLKVGQNKIEAQGGISDSVTDFDKALDDSDVYNEYSDIVFKSFPFSEILQEIQDLINGAGLSRIVVFFDDFSELSFVDQRLFVDVVLSPLNNSSNEAVKLKVAGYPGRVYYGKIDPSKVDTIYLDFSDLYESTEMQEMERSATSYAYRLLKTRFEVFGIKLEDYFEINNESSLDDMMKLMFQASFNVPRIMGNLLHILFLDKISKQQKINSSSIKLASKKYYENTILKYFDRLNRYALEPFENKLDRHNQKQLLDCLIKEISDLKSDIVSRKVGGKYFESLGSNPPVSHFTVSPNLEEMLSSLESNFFITRYKKIRTKYKTESIVYALFLGLCESERFTWGYPEGRDYRHYFQQRCFEYTRAISNFLSSNQTIRCGNCGCCHSMDKKDSFELFKWKCPECQEGICSITNLFDDFKDEVANLNRDVMLEKIEFDIINTLNEEGRGMRAGEISKLIDTTHQMVGRRTNKLKEIGLVDKYTDDFGNTYNEITIKCKETYFV